MNTFHANHANHIFIIGKVLQTWTYSDDRICRVSMRRASFALLPESLVEIVEAAFAEANPKFSSIPF